MININKMIASSKKMLHGVVWYYVVHITYILEHAFLRFNSKYLRNVDKQRYLILFMR